MEIKNLPECCKPKNEKNKSLRNGILFGLVPHIGCIAFILFSLLGLTVAASIFQPLLAKAYFFYIMIALSLVFASGSAYFYLRRFGGLKKAKEHKKYLTILYGTTIGVSAILYLFVFPLVAGAYSGEQTIGPQSMKIQVQIPCSGHAPLIIDELQKAGVNSTKFSFPNKFQITYDPSKVTKNQILALNIFNEYPAKVLN